MLLHLSQLVWIQASHSEVYINTFDHINEFDHNISCLCSILKWLHVQKDLQIFAFYVFTFYTASQSRLYCYFLTYSKIPFSEPVD